MFFKNSFNPEQSTLEDTECSICYANYEQTDSIRQLVCGHHFHEKCVDVWLLGHQNKCPLCLAVVRQNISKHFFFLRNVVTSKSF